MSNARARDWQLKRDKLKPARVTNRVVGTPLMIPAHGKEWNASASVDMDISCDRCGYHICGCARKETVHYTLSSFTAPAIFDVGPETARAPVEGSALISATRDGETLWFTSQPAADAWLGRREEQPKVEELAPGWRVSPHGQTMGRRQYSHEKGVDVWEAGDCWAFTVRPKQVTYESTAPTRDEAMARALGWVKHETLPGWKLPGTDGYVSPYPRDRWGADSVRTGCPSSGDGFPSLPHAIAWARGDA